MVLNIMEYRGLSMNIDEYCNINVHCKSGNSKEQCGLPMHIAKALNSLCKRLLFARVRFFARGCLKKQLSGKFVTIFVPWQVRGFWDLDRCIMYYTYDAFPKPLDTKWTHGVKLRPSFGEASASADFGGYALN